MGDIVAQVQAVSNLVKTLLPVIGLLGILAAGGIYAFGTMSGSDELRGRMNSWAQKIGVGGAIAVVIGVASPAIMTWLQGF